MTAGRRARAAICIVTYNSEGDLPGALAAVAALAAFRPQNSPVGGAGESPFGSGMEEEPSAIRPQESPVGGAGESPFGSGREEELSAIRPQFPFGGAGESPFGSGMEEKLWAIRPQESPFGGVRGGNPLHYGSPPSPSEERGAGGRGPGLSEPLELVIADCGSSDGSVALAWAFAAPGVDCRVVPLGENRGFSGGMNAAIAASSAPWILALNPDARPRPDFLGVLLERAQNAAGKIGALTGRLVRPEQNGERLLDACGMVLRRSWRHLDRGSGEPDRGQYAAAELVFGGTGAATLYRREALLDVAFADGQIFDTAFHSYREDAELSFRLQERGWACIYEPAAVAEHRRTVVPAGRSQVSPFINYHSFKNRYLLRAYHQSAGNFLRTLLPALLRDLGALAWVLAREHGSLPAYGWLFRHRREILARRRYLRARRSADAEIWFSRESLPLPDA